MRQPPSAYFVDEIFAKAGDVKACVVAKKNIQEINIHSHMFVRGLTSKLSFGIRKTVKRRGKNSQYNSYGRYFTIMSGTVYLEKCGERFRVRFH